MFEEAIASAVLCNAAEHTMSANIKIFPSRSRHEHRCLPSKETNFPVGLLAPFFRVHTKRHHTPFPQVPWWFPKEKARNVDDSIRYRPDNWWAVSNGMNPNGNTWRVKLSHRWNLVHLSFGIWTTCGNCSNLGHGCERISPPWWRRTCRSNSVKCKRRFRRVKNTARVTRESRAERSSVSHDM